jgi:DNA-binding transcriptional regulator YiaG
MTAKTGVRVTSRGKTVKVAVMKEAEKEAYTLWRSIPAMLRILTAEEAKKMGYPVDDLTFAQLLKLRTKGEFADAFGVHRNTITNWEAEEGFQGRVDALSLNDNVMRFKKDVDFSFTQKVLRHGDQPRVKLWKQLYEGWSEKIEHRNTNLNVDVVSLVEGIEARNKQLREEAGV